MVSLVGGLMVWFAKFYDGILRLNVRAEVVACSVEFIADTLVRGEWMSQYLVRIAPIPAGYGAVETDRSTT